MKNIPEFKVSEEVARWAFEVKLRNNKDWFVAFTNPTAGPWKRIMAPNKKGIIGEVFRFPRDMDRPDLLLVNDNLKTIVIVEAKDTLPKLRLIDQVKKSSVVIKELENVLMTLSNNEFWAERSEYKVVPGLLWGSEQPTEQYEIKLCIQSYVAELESLNWSSSNDILTVEVQKKYAAERLDCCLSCFETKSGSVKRKDNDFIRSFSFVK